MHTVINWAIRPMTFRLVVKCPWCSASQTITEEQIGQGVKALRDVGEDAIDLQCLEPSCLRTFTASPRTFLKRTFGCECGRVFGTRSQMRDHVRIGECPIHPKGSRLPSDRPLGAAIVCPLRRKVVNVVRTP